jgi:hypothetical protein
MKRESKPQSLIPKFRKKCRLRQSVFIEHELFGNAFANTFNIVIYPGSIGRCLLLELAAAARMPYDWNQQPPSL